MKDTIVDALEQPEYTGENRCGACTVVNLVIAAVIGAVLARKSKLAATVAVGVSVVLIYLRGYLVPGTPALTKRYLPASVLRWFGKEPEPVVRSGLGPIESSTAGDAGRVDAARADTEEPVVIEDVASETAADSPTDDDHSADVGADSTTETSTADTGTDGSAADVAEQPEALDPETYFLELDVVEPCEDVDDLCLTEDFETAWQDAIDAIDVDDIEADDAAAAFGLESDEEAFEIDAFGDAWVLRREGATIGQWPSQAALVADVTAARVLEDWDETWEVYEPAAKGELLNSLRLFLETCPTSGGEVVMGEETVESCCQSHDVIVVSCVETDERLFEFPADDLEA